MASAESNKDVDVTVIIPTMNERETIAECIERAKKALERMGLKYEIIVSDSSTDDTPEIAQRHGARVVRPDQLGYGYAYIYALRYARGKYIIMADGDGTYDLEEIPKLLQPLMRGEVDIVLGTRLRGKIMPGAMPWLHRYIGNPLLTFMLNKFYGTKVSDSHSGFRALTRDAIERIKPSAKGMEFATEMLIKAAYAGLRIAEVPITYHPRKGGQSKLKSFRDGWRHLKILLILTPKYLYYTPGIAFMIAGIALMLAALLRANLGYSPGIHSSILGGMLAILGYSLVITGTIADVYLTYMLGRPTSRFTVVIYKHFDVERAMLLGAILMTIGAAYLLYLFLIWINSGYRFLPLRGENVIAFVLLILGLQSVFSGFVFYVLKEAWRNVPRNNYNLTMPD